MVNGVAPSLALSLVGVQQSGDGVLALGEVAGLTLNADLAGLWAWQTGKGRQSNAEGVGCLAQAFLQASSRRVGCSLWRVDHAAPLLTADALALTDGQGRPEGSFHIIDGRALEIRDGQLQPVQRRRRRKRVKANAEDTAAMLGYAPLPDNTTTTPCTAAASGSDDTTGLCGQPARWSSPSTDGRPAEHLCADCAPPFLSDGQIGRAHV